MAPLLLRAGGDRRGADRPRDSWRAAIEQLRSDGRTTEAEAIEEQLAQIEREGEQGRDPLRPG